MNPVTSNGEVKCPVSPLLMMSSNLYPYIWSKIHHLTNDKNEYDITSTLTDNSGWNLPKLHSVEKTWRKIKICCRVKACFFLLSSISAFCFLMSQLK